MKVQNEVILNYLSIHLRTECDMWTQMLIPILEKTLQHSLIPLYKPHLYEVFSDLNVIEMTWRVLLKTQILMQKLAEPVVSSSSPRRCCCCALAHMCRRKCHVLTASLMVRGSSRQAFVMVLLAFSCLSKLATKIKMSFLFFKNWISFCSERHVFKTATLLSPHSREEGQGPSWQHYSR